MFPFDRLDWLAAGVTLFAAELLARRQRAGWLVQAANAFLWGWLMCHARLWGFVALEGAIFVQSVWGFYRWRSCVVIRARDKENVNG